MGTLLPAPLQIYRQRNPLNTQPLLCVKYVYCEVFCTFCCLEYIACTSVQAEQQGMYGIDRVQRKKK